MLRSFLARLARPRHTPEAAAPVSGQDESAKAAAELTARGEAQRLQGAYAQAERTLLSAIDLSHDFGPAHCQLGLVYLDQGRAEDAADCFELANHYSAQSPALYANLAAAYFAMDRYEAAEEACRKALALDPELPALHMTQGRVLKRRGRLDEAAAAFRAVLALAPEDADAACQLGFVLLRSGRYDASREVFTALLSTQPDFADAHHNFGLLQLETGYPAEALASFQRALVLKPGTIATEACVAHALRDLGRLEEALAAYDAALAREPQFGDAVINRCYALLMHGDYERGWTEYERRFAATGGAQRDLGFPAWQGQALAGKRILVFAEQGLGDEIMFASCFPDLIAAAGHCLIECNTRLAGLFQYSFPGARIHGGEKDADRAWLKELPAIDFQLSIGSLPLHFRRRAAEFPVRRGYLRADPARVAAWGKTLGEAAGKRRIGIAWRGGSLLTRQHLRSTQLTNWLPVLSNEGCEFVSLQYGEHGAEIANLRERGIAMREVGTAIDDFEELAALIGALDLVITVDNTVAHLAGALGQRTCVALPFSPEWRYPRQGDAIPWYPSARLFRQGRPREWDDVIGAIAAALAHERWGDGRRAPAHNPESGGR